MSIATWKITLLGKKKSSHGVVIKTGTVKAVKNLASIWNIGEAQKYLMILLPETIFLVIIRLVDR